MVILLSYIVVGLVTGWLLASYEYYSEDSPDKGKIGKTYANLILGSICWPIVIFFYSTILSVGIIEQIKLSSPWDQFSTRCNGGVKKILYKPKSVRLKESEKARLDLLIRNRELSEQLGLGAEEYDL